MDKILYHNEVQKHTVSMDLKLKPVKCRLLSVKSGKPTKIDFFIDSERVKSVDEDPQKFLGSLVTFPGKTAEVYKFIQSKI